MIRVRNGGEFFKMLASEGLTFELPAARLIGKFLGLKIYADPNIPADLVRLEDAQGRVVGTFRITR